MFHNCWLCSIFVDHVPHWNVLELQSCFGHAQMVVYDMCASRNQRSQIKWANISEFFVLIVMRDRVQRGFDARVLLFPNVLSDHSKAWSFHHHQLPAIDASLKKLGIHQNLSPCEHEHLRYIFYIYIYILYIYITRFSSSCILFYPDGRRQVLPDWKLAPNWDGVREMLSKMQEAMAHPKAGSNHNCWGLHRFTLW